MKNRIKSLLAVVALSGFGFTSLVSAATTWNATDEFSIANGNPNDVWTYGYMDSGWTAFTAYTQNNGTDGWYVSGIDSWIWLNNRGSEQYGVPEGWLALSPGTGGEDPVLRWTAPEDVSGLVQVSGQFLAGDSASMNVAIFQGSVRTPENTLWSGTDFGSFDFDVNVSPGDTLNFTIDGPFSYGNTPISATIQAVPEPTTTALLIGEGTLALAFARLRFRKA